MLPFGGVTGQGGGVGVSGTGVPVGSLVGTGVDSLGVPVGMVVGTELAQEVMPAAIATLIVSFTIRLIFSPRDLYIASIELP